MKSLKGQKATKETPLPPIEDRKVIGTWLIAEPGFHMTRSIEQVDEKFYLVVRMRGNDGAELGGDAGLPLERVSQTQFKGVPPNPTKYTIDEHGSLLCASPAAKGVFFIGKPQTALWPK